MPYLQLLDHSFVHEMSPSEMLGVFRKRELRVHGDTVEKRLVLSLSPPFFSGCNFEGLMILGVNNGVFNSGVSIILGC